MCCTGVILNIPQMLLVVLLCAGRIAEGAPKAKKMYYMNYQSLFGHMVLWLFDTELLARQGLVIEGLYILGVHWDTSNNRYLALSMVSPKNVLFP